MSFAWERQMKGDGKEACKDGRGAYLMNRVHIWAIMLTKSSTVKMPVKTACRRDIKKRQKRCTKENNERKSHKTRRRPWKEN